LASIYQISWDDNFLVFAWGESLIFVYFQSFVIHD